MQDRLWKDYCGDRTMQISKILNKSIYDMKKLMMFYFKINQQKLINKEEKEI